jgi:hypothetical protein
MMDIIQIWYYLVLNINFNGNWKLWIFTERFDMKVKNTGRVLFPKGVDLERDIYPNEEGAVIFGCEQNQRITNAIASGSLQVVADVLNAKVPVQDHKPVLKHYKAQDGSIIAVPEGNNLSVDLGTPAISPKFLIDEFPPASIKVPEVKIEAGELAEFMRRKGGSRAKYVQQMVNLVALKQAMVSIKGKGGKVKIALEVRIAELSHAPREGMMGL